MDASSAGRLPRTFDECRTRFRDACDRQGHTSTAEPITARGPGDELLNIDHVVIGSATPKRALVLLSGVHGVEAPVNSAMQCDLIDRLGPGDLPPDVGIVIVHIVNPWGMAHGRRQNESNVDLNRNWARSRTEPEHNEAYDEIHHLVCPDSDDVLDVGELFAVTKPLIAEHGEEWVRRAITRGQFRHADGLHFGGDVTEESTAIVERVVLPVVAHAERLFVLDLHTGHGPYGEITVLSDRPADSPQDRLVRSLFDRVESTPDRPDGTSRVKSGPIARGIADEAARVNRDVDGTVATVEVGTADDLEQLAATYQEQWVHRCRPAASDDPTIRRIRRRYCECFTPDDASWAEAAFEGGRRHIDAALGALVDGC